MFLERLNEIADRIEGSQALSLVASDGIPVETSQKEGVDLDIELLAAELMAQVRAISKNHLELSVGEVRHFSVTTNRMLLMITTINPEYSLMLVAAEATHQGRARFELRRSVLTLEQDL